MGMTRKRDTIAVITTANQNGLTVENVIANDDAAINSAMAIATTYATHTFQRQHIEKRTADISMDLSSLFAC